jgi:hypothetical protein
MLQLQCSNGSSRRKSKAIFERIMTELPNWGKKKQKTAVTSH